MLGDVHRLMMKLPPLNALRVFYVLGTTTSLRRAAEILCLTHTAAVRQIKELESWFGVKLVTTSVRGTELTLEGKRLHKFASRAFELIAQGTEEIRPSRPAEEVRIWAYPGFANFWILPRWGSLQDALPGTEISLMPTEQTPAFLEHDVDAMIRYGPATDSRLSSAPLFSPRLVAVASSSWISRNPKIRRPQDLLSVPLIHERYQEDWQNWFEALGYKNCGHLAGPRVGVSTAVLEAVLRDQGPGIFPEVFGLHESRNGLQLLFPEVAPRIGGYYFVTRADRDNEPKIARLRNWFLKMLKDA